MSETSLNSSPIDGPIDQYGQVIVAHGTEIARDLGAKQIDQAHTLEAGQVG